MKVKWTFFSLIAFTILIFSGCEKNEELLNNDLSLKKAVVEQQSPGMVPNEMLVRFKAGTSAELKNKALGMVNGKVKETVLTKMMERTGDKEGFLVVNIPGQALEAMARVKGLPEIEYAEPNYIYTHCATSNDPYYTNGLLWGMYGDTSPLKTNAFGSQAAEAWARTLNPNTGSSDVWIGIIDEGYMYTHEDLAANAGKNPGEIAGNSKDDDGNGYVDDVYGWDFAGGNNTVYDGAADDHGTHVAGTIGAKGGNGIGVAGVCWNVKLLNAKFLGTSGGTTTNAIKAVDYFTDLKTRHGLNLVATNNSWGGGSYSTDLFKAIDRAQKAGILFIAAAGNEKRNNDRKPSYPASYNLANIISVASITSTGTLSSFSNYGLVSVDLGAPGSAIYSTLPGNTYGSYSGTSMATPHVTGAAALYASTHSGATAAQIKTAILGSVVLTSSLNGKCVTGGRLNVSGF